MKKLIFLIALVAISFGISAQVSVEGVITQSRRYNEATLNEFDAVTTTTSISKYYSWDAPSGVKYKITVKADSIASELIYGRFILKESTNGVDFTNIDTVLYYGATSDTTFVFDKTGSISTTLSQSLTLADSSSVFSLTQLANDYRYTRYVGVEGQVDSTGNTFQWTGLDITVWFEK